MRQVAIIALFATSLFTTNCDFLGRNLQQIAINNATIINSTTGAPSNFGANGAGRVTPRVAIPIAAATNTTKTSRPAGAAIPIIHVSNSTLPGNQRNTPAANAGTVGNVVNTAPQNFAGVNQQANGTLASGSQALPSNGVAVAAKNATNNATGVITNATNNVTGAISNATNNATGAIANSTLPNATVGANSTTRQINIANATVLNGTSANASASTPSNATAIPSNTTAANSTETNSRIAPQNTTVVDNATIVNNTSTEAAQPTNNTNNNGTAANITLVNNTILPSA